MAYHPVPPASVPLTGSLEQRVRLLTDLVSRKADATTQPMFDSVLLHAPGGAVWRVSVDDAGALVATVVSRD